jgi:hypothetical protein
VLIDAVVENLHGRRTVARISTILESQIGDFTSSSSPPGVEDFTIAALNVIDKTLLEVHV